MKKRLLYIISFSAFTFSCFAMDEGKAFVTSEAPIATEISWKEVATLPADMRNVILNEYRKRSDSHYLIRDMMTYAFVANQKTLRPIPAAKVTSLAFNSQNNLLAVGLQNGSVNILDMRGVLQSTIWPIDPARLYDIQPISLVTFNPVKNELAIVAKFKYLALWDTNTQKMIRKGQYNHRNMIFTASGTEKVISNTVYALSKDRNLLATKTPWERIELSTPAANNPLTFTVQKTISTHNYRTTALAINPAKTLLACSNEDLTIDIYDIATETKLHTISGKQPKSVPTRSNKSSDIVYSLAFSSDDILFACSAQNDLKIYKVSEEEVTCLNELTLPYPSDYSLAQEKPFAQEIALSDNNEFLAIGYHDGRVALINIEKLLALRAYLASYCTFNELIALYRLMLDHAATKDAPYEISSKSMIKKMLEKHPTVEYNGKKIDITHELFNTLTYFANGKHIHRDIKQLYNLNLMKKIPALPVIFSTLAYLGLKTMVHYFQ